MTKATHFVFRTELRTGLLRALRLSLPTATLSRRGLPMIRVRFARSMLAGGVCALALASAAVAQTRDFNIAAGDLKAALAQYIRQSGAKLIYRDDEVKGVQTAGVHGALSADEALKSLLNGTRLVIETDSSGARAIVRAEGSHPTSDANTANPPSVPSADNASEGQEN